MVDDEDVACGVSRLTHRKAFDDVTNRTRKRPFSLNSGDCPRPSKIRNGTDDGDFHLRKQDCLGIENLVRAKNNTETGINNRDKFVSLPRTKRDSGLSTCHPTSGKSYLSNGANEEYSVLETTSVNVASGSLAEDGNSLRGPYEPSVSLPTFSELLNTSKPQFEEVALTHGLLRARSFDASEGLVILPYANNGGDLNLGKSARSNCEAIECSKHPGSQNSKLPVLEKCSGQKGHSNAVLGLDLLDSCSCSFCLKAAGIWSDVHHQDIKGRITALKNSQKEANTLVQNISGEMEALIRDQGSSSRSSELGFNLMDHWRSLFLHMENVLAHESHQLEESCHTLKDLRDKCKMDLEMINDEHSGNP